ncbi:MAG: trypsin-like peptidase domain-containing protein, partial [Gemmatimonadaceae bacterium]
MSARDLFAALTIALGAACEGKASDAQVAAASPPAVTQQIDASRRTAITSAVARVSPAVVTVQTETVERVPVDVFEQFFGGRSGQQVQPGLGSGFVIRPEGIIVTNAHVVAGASKISVMLPDGTMYAATLVGSDETNDLAVIKIDARNLPVVALGNSEALLIGEWAIAIGNPFGFLLGNTEPSVTAGVISATGRNLIGRSEGSGVYVGMIQTDASINPGNSGGPLVNGSGEVIGVNSSIYSPSGGSIGLGFAIPINRARRIVDDLVDHGNVRRPWIGEKLRASPTDNPRDIVTAGVIVSAVVEGSPASKAGLQPGDQ